MRKKLIAALLAGACGLTGLATSAEAVQKVSGHNQIVKVQDEFEARVLVDNLGSPWEMLWGADNQLWITERETKQVSKVDPKSGVHKVLYTFDNAFEAFPHQGVLGMAFGPNFLQGAKENFLYVAYTYEENGNKYARIVRLTYDKKADTLGNETVILDKLPASSDHNSGRLRLGPDEKLYYTIGDQGHNQGMYVDREIQSQQLPTAEQVANGDFSSYPGKVLRLNLDGSIPSDNPVLEGVRSHVYAYGFRNSQGLCFVGDKLFATEHGPSTDDEINLIEAGGNYGWPYIAGYRDNQSYVYANYSKASKELQVRFDPNVIPEGVPTQRETDFDVPNLKDPLKSFNVVRNGYNFSEEGFGQLAYVAWPTIAPSDLTYYPADGKIEIFRNSLLVTTLKSGAVYQVKLDGKAAQVQGDSAKFFKTNNRYRAILVSPDTSKIYVATDNVGNGMGRNGKPITNMDNKGAIIVFSEKK